MKITILSLGLWLAGAQGFATQACLAGTATPQTNCGGYDDQAGRDSSCCITVKAQKDVDAAVPKNDLPEKPVPIEFVILDTSTASWPEAAEDIVREAAFRAEGPPLYLRNSVLLI